MKAIRLLRYLSEYFAMTHKGAIMSIQEAIVELEALQSRNCEGCKYCAKVFSYTYPLCTRDEQSPFQIHNKEVLACRFHEAKEQ